LLFLKYKGIESISYLIKFLGKFKSGVQANNTNGMSVQELMELLNSRDHNGEWRNLSISGQGKVTVKTLKFETFYKVNP